MKSLSTRYMSILNYKIKQCKYGNDVILIQFYVSYTITHHIQLLLTFCEVYYVMYRILLLLYLLTRIVLVYIYLYVNHTQSHVFLVLF